MVMRDPAAMLRAKFPFYLPPPDPRSEAEIEADIAEEIAFHLEEAERELREAGESADAARALAKERFGDIDRYKHEMKRIALRERTMLQRINLVLMIVVILVVGAVSAQVYITQRYNTLALQEITNQIAEMKAGEGSQARTGYVIVEGDVEKPGRYEFGLDEDRTLRDLVKAFDISDDKVLRRRNLKYHVSSILTSEEGNRLLRDGEAYFVATQDELDGYRSELLGAAWIQITESGEHVPDGITFEVIPADDIMNMSNAPRCEVENPRDSSQILDMVFNSRNTLLMHERDPDDRMHWRYGRADAQGQWSLRDGRLYLNMLEYAPTPGEPVIFEKTE